MNAERVEIGAADISKLEVTTATTTATKDVKPVRKLGKKPRCRFFGTKKGIFCRRNS